MKYDILLVEDDPWLAQLYQDILQSHELCEVQIAFSADAALEALDAKHNFQLILLDMFLPIHNGVEFLHEYASYADINHIPVIVLSSVFQHDLKMSQQRWKHYGVERYLYKPLTKPADLMAAVKKQLAVAQV